MANNHPNAPNQQSSNAGPARPPDQLPKVRAEYLAEQYGYTPEQVNVIRRAICIGATDEELEFFLATAKRVQLDPFARQIWFVKRRQKIEDSQGNEQWIDVGRPETSIDGFRTIAERSGEYEGQAPIEWCGKDGKWCDVWLKEEPPFAARAKVYRTKLKEPIVTVALLSEYRPIYRNGNFPAMWKKMPANQLGVRAEAQAFRKAFPRDLSGMVTDGEGEAMEIGASYAAPAKPEPKAIAAKQANMASAILDAQTSPDAREPAPATAPSVTPEQVTDVIDSVQESEHADDLDREMARCLKIITTAATREDLQEVGRMITAAKIQKKKTDDDAHANAVIDVLEPMLQKRWRELPKK